MTEIRDNDIRLKAEKLLLQVSCFHRSYERRRQHAQGEQFFISVGHETRSKRIASCLHAIQRKLYLDWIMSSE